VHIELDSNLQIVSRILDDEEFGDALMELYAKRVYQQARGNE